MILICPSCDTRYTLSDDAVGVNGRNVRCRACGHSWFAKPAHVLEAEAAVQDESGLTRAQVERLRQKAQANSAGRTGPHAEIREKERQRRKRNRMIAATTAWVAGAALFSGAAAASVVFREKVVDIWPKTASLYALAGMEVNRFGLEFSRLEARRSFDGTTPILTIDGAAINISDTHRPSPLVLIRLMSETEETVHEEIVNLIDEVVAPGAASDFSARIISPPMDSYRLEVGFETDFLRSDVMDVLPAEEGHGVDHIDAPSAQDHDADSHADAAHDEESHAVEGHTGDSHGETAHGPETAEQGDDHGAGQDDGHH